ncbi:MAG TPA: CvpA family protein [Verrucomicrobiae bacterium]|jgi:hypothetical protein|nr:CvpA family protein [Verrucomicrobiae bacterium]
MVWIIAVLCLALVGAIGFFQGPVRSLFGLFGLLAGAVLAGPLRPLTKPLLPLLGLHHQIWGFFVPQMIAFIVVLVIFIITGNVVHHKILMHFKYDEDDARFYAWNRLYTRLGFCVGLLNGAVYFVVLLVPIYIGGFFTTVAEGAQGEGGTAGARFMTHARGELHGLGLDRVLAAYDPLPPQVYQATDIAALVLHNPLLENRLSQYPPFLTLAQRPEFQALGNDLQLQQMLQTQAPIGDILKYPPVQAIVTNTAITSDVEALLGNDLDDLQHYLLTGQSAKYDAETILGTWTINVPATYAQLRKRGGMTPLQMRNNRLRMASYVNGLTLVCTVNHEFIMKKQSTMSPDASVVATGKWQKSGDTYEVELPGSKPPTTEIEIQNGIRMLLPKDGDVLAFDKD